MVDLLVILIFIGPSLYQLYRFRKSAQGRPGAAATAGILLLVLAAAVYIGILQRMAYFY